MQFWSLDLSEVILTTSLPETALNAKYKKKLKVNERKRDSTEHRSENRKRGTAPNTAVKKEGQHRTPQ